MTVGADSAFFDLAVGGSDGVEVDFERVIGKLKPGAHLLALSPIATHHSNTISIEDAGMEIRDTVVWVFDSGGQTPDMVLVTVARKPLEGTVAANVLAHGTGGLNVDGCRVGTTDTYSYPNGPGGKSHHYSSDKRSSEVRPNATESNPLGRWPANLIHDGTDKVVGLFPQTGINRGGNSQQINAGTGRYNWNTGTDKAAPDGVDPGYGDSGSAARFFYTAPCLDGLITYLLKLITQPNRTVLTNCDKEKLPNDYNYIGQEL